MNDPFDTDDEIQEQAMPNRYDDSPVGDEIDCVVESHEHVSSDTPTDVPDQEAPDKEAASVHFALQEMWSLQREVLKEMIGGFRRLEQTQADLKSGLDSQLESQPAFSDEPQFAMPDPEFENMLKSRFEALEGLFEKMERSMRGVLGESGSSLYAQYQDSQDAIRTTLSDSLHESEAVVRSTFNEAMEKTHKTVHTSLSESQQLTRSMLDEFKSTIENKLSSSYNLIHESLSESSRVVQENVIESSNFVRENLTQSHETIRSDIQETHSKVKSELHQNQEHVHDSLERVRGELRGELQNTQRTVGATVAESLTSMRELTAGAVSETRSDMEKMLTRLLDEVQQVRTLRTQVETALEALSHEMRDVSAVTARLESSTVQTQELIDEQRKMSITARDQRRREEARKFNNAGVLCYHQGAFDTSLEHFRKAVQLDDTLAEAYNNLGLSYTEMGREDEATNAFKKALELDPSVGQVYNNLGYLYYRRGDLEGAVEMYQRAVQRSTDTSAAYANLGNALYRMERVDESVSAWKRAIEIDPANLKASAALERLGLEERPSSP